jgi:acyl carrier protein
MLAEEITAKIIEIIRAVLDDNTIVAETNMYEMAMDSLRFIKMVVTIESTFKVRFEAEYLSPHKYQRVQDICSYIAGKLV